MNYYPYFNGMPYVPAAPVAKTGLFKGLLGNINFSSILNGTQKTLGIVNQALPLIKEARPVINNAKTMFRVMNEFKKSEIPVTNNINNSNSNISNNTNVNNDTVNETETIKTPTYQNNLPTFFQ